MYFIPRILSSQEVPRMKKFMPCITRIIFLFILVYFEYVASTSVNSTVEEGSECQWVRLGYGQDYHIICDDYAAGEAEPFCAPEHEGHAVRCCSETSVTGFDRVTCNDGAVMWAASEYIGCVSAATYAEAEATCLVFDARLCTEAEIYNGCATGSGCGFDCEYSWTSISEESRSSVAPMMLKQGTGSKLGVVLMITTFLALFVVCASIVVCYVLRDKAKKKLLLPQMDAKKSRKILVHSGDSTNIQPNEKETHVFHDKDFEAITFHHDELELKELKIDTQLIETKLTSSNSTPSQTSPAPANIIIQDAPQTPPTQEIAFPASWSPWSPPEKKHTDVNIPEVSWSPPKNWPSTKVQPIGRIKLEPLQDRCQRHHHIHCRLCQDSNSGSRIHLEDPF